MAVLFYTLNFTAYLLCFMLFTVRYTLVQSAVLRSYIVRPSVCLSVCLSVTFRYRNHIGWNSSQIISRPNSFRPLLWLTPTWAIWCTFIRSITTTVINNFGKSSRGHSQGLPKFFRVSIYRVHCVVIFAIAGLSCYSFVSFYVHWCN